MGEGGIRRHAAAFRSARGCFASCCQRLRQAGFGEFIDSEDMLVEWLEWMQAQKLLPPRSGRRR